MVYHKFLPDQNEQNHDPEEIQFQHEEKEDGDNEEGEDDEERGTNKPASQKKDDTKDYEKVKEHMHMVLARYAKEGVIDYKEAAQIHDV